MNILELQQTQDIESVKLKKPPNPNRREIQLKCLTDALVKNKYKTAKQLYKQEQNKDTGIRELKLRSLFEPHFTEEIIEYPPEYREAINDRVRRATILTRLELTGNITLEQLQELDALKADIARLKMLSVLVAQNYLMEQFNRLVIDPYPRGNETMTIG